MAICRSTVIADPSGSVGGITFSRNRGGMYMRNRTVPVNPNSTYQQAVRSAMAQLSARWSGTLTTEQRALWDAYAAAVLLPNAIGDLVNVGGLGMYIRTNVPIIQTSGGGGAIIDDAPTLYNLGDYTAPSIQSINESTLQIALNFDNTDEWANEDDSTMLVYTSAPQTPARNFFKGPFRYADAIDGNATTPPTSPAALNLAIPAVEGQKVFARVRVIRADGRLSAEWFGAKIVAA